MVWELPHSQTYRANPFYSLRKVQNKHTYNLYVGLFLGHLLHTSTIRQSKSQVFFIKENLT